jgi:hypothetical protein
MIKRIIFYLFVCVSMNTFSYAVQAPRRAVPSGKHTVVEPWKYGVSLSSGILSRRIGGFVEYKMNMIGMEAGLSWFRDRYGAAGVPLKGSEVGVGVINYSTFVIPLVLKLYPGSDRQFAIRAGLQVGYAIQNKIYLIRNFKGRQVIVSFQEALDDKNYVDVSSVAASEDKINDWYCGSIVGFEYESDFGFIWGFDYMNKLTSFIEAEEEKYAFSFMLNLGMNLGVFFY